MRESLCCISKRHCVRRHWVQWHSNGFSGLNGQFRPQSLKIIIFWKFVDSALDDEHACWLLKCLCVKYIHNDPSILHCITLTFPAFFYCVPLFQTTPEGIYFSFVYVQRLMTRRLVFNERAPPFGLRYSGNAHNLEHHEEINGRKWKRTQLPDHRNSSCFMDISVLRTVRFTSCDVEPKN